MTPRSIPGIVLAAFLFGAGGTLHAQESDPFVETFRQGVIDMSKRTLEVVKSIHSVEDADAAEPRIAKIMNDFVIMLGGLAEYLDQGFDGSLETLSMMQTDPELVEWSEKVNAVIRTLQEEHPDAALRLTEIGSAQSAKVMEAMTNLMLKLQEPEETGTEASEVPAEE